MIISVATNIAQNVIVPLLIKIVRAVWQGQSFTTILSNTMQWLMAVAGSSVRFQHSNFSQCQGQELAKIVQPTVSVMDYQLIVRAAWTALSSLIKTRECASKNALRKLFTVSMSRLVSRAAKIVPIAQGLWYMIVLLARRDWSNSRPRMALYATIISVKRVSIMTRSGWVVSSAVRSAPSATAHLTCFAWIGVHIPILKLPIHQLTRCSSVCHAKMSQLTMISTNHHTMIRRSTVMRFVEMDSIWASMSVMMGIV